MADAERAAAKGLALKPSSLRLLKEHAKNAEARKHWQDALARWKDVLKKSRRKKIPSAVSHIIEASCRLGEFDEALVLMEVYAERFPNSMPLKEKQLSAPETAFCRRHGIHPMAFADYGYRLTPAGNKTTENSGNHAESVDVLHVTARPRFGNTIIQLSNALNLARTLDIKEIWLPGFWYLKEQFTTRDGIRIKNPPSTDDGSGKGKSILAGDFFQRRYFFDVLTPNRLPISSFLDSECLQLKPSKSFGKRDLVIHLRSGDVFRTGQKVHPDYGQPPLAFYEKILASEQWDSVTIVCEDDANPVLAHLLDSARSLTDNITKMSGSLQEDIECLLNAKTLVASSGTFIPAIAELSENLETIFCFNNTTAFQALEVSIMEILDNTGEYLENIMRGNWENTPSQRLLMLHYPMENLIMKEYSPEGKA